MNTGAVLSQNEDKSRQRMWDVPQSEAAVVKLLDEADQISRARLLAAAKRESGLWLQAETAPILGTLLDPETFRKTIALRVGSDVCVAHTCPCDRLMDAK